MMEWINSTLGTIFYSVCLFSLGAWVGKPFFCWLKGQMPWNKCDNCKE